MSATCTRCQRPLAGHVAPLGFCRALPRGSKVPEVEAPRQLAGGQGQASPAGSQARLPGSTPSSSRHRYEAWGQVESGPLLIATGPTLPEAHARLAVLADGAPLLRHGGRPVRP